MEQRAKMRFLGVVQGTNAKGHVIAKSAGSLDLKPGASVFDKSQRIIGLIGRVFGPVKAPYLSIKPRKQAAVLVETGSELYIDN